MDDVVEAVPVWLSQYPPPRRGGPKKWLVIGGAALALLLALGVGGPGRLPDRHHPGGGRDLGRLEPLGCRAGTWRPAQLPGWPGHPGRYTGSFGAVHDADGYRRQRQHHYRASR